jgi:hypothetical protein
VWGLTLCYAAALVAICTAGILGPETMTRKVYRDVDYDNMEVHPSLLILFFSREYYVVYPTIESLLGTAQARTFRRQSACCLA